MQVSLPTILLLVVTGSYAQSSLASLRTYERIREALVNAIQGRPANKARQLERAYKRNKLQEKREQQSPFPCATAGGRSASRPTSVHRLRPGDIDVVGAMGDSLTASFGVYALSLVQVLVENRGMSWTAGGESTWREFLTLPNILKEFNPNLVGYSYNDSLSHQKASQFNVAEGAAMSRDIPFQARNLIKRMRSDSRVDYKDDWKLVTLMIGPNDFCLDICYVKSSELPENHRRDLMQTLDLLRDNMPRTLVNIVLTPSLEVLVNFRGGSPTCTLINIVECPCLFGLPNEHRRQEFFNIFREWQQVDIEVANSERYRNKDDFAVVLQTFTKDIVFPTVDTPKGKMTDFTFLSADCFHFSQKANAKAANALWNNMLEPVGNKSTNWEETFSRFICPTKDMPYLSTAGNSRSYRWKATHVC